MYPQEDFGGNQVRRIGSLPTRSCTLADDAYRYQIVALRAGETFAPEGLATGAGWMLTGDVTVTQAGARLTWPTGRAILFDGPGVEVRADRDCVFLFAGTAELSGNGAGIRMPEAEELKRVEKPWGEELWINGRHPTYAFKRIVLHAGNRTSLQYHEFKRETNLLFEGQARLHFDTVAGGHDGPYKSEPIESIGVIDVTPGILHRIEAVTDVTLFEVSTPHLDDVIRVSDDSNRADGLIASEHAGGATS